MLFVTALVMVNFKFFRYIHASYFHFLMNVNVVELK